MQDDKEDWDAESEKMAGIYANAAVVIVNAHSQHPWQGFLNSDQFLHHAWSTYAFSGESGLFNIRRWRLHFPDVAEQSDTTKRAWTLQEQLLARRCLLFTSDEVTWECQQGCKCEC